MNPRHILTPTPLPQKRKKKACRQWYLCSGVQNSAASSQDFLHGECCYCCYCCHQAGVSCSLKAAVLVIFCSQLCLLPHLPVSCSNPKSSVPSFPRTVNRISRIICMSLSDGCKALMPFSLSFRDLTRQLSL